MATMTEFLQNYMAIMQLKQQRETAAVAAVTARTQQLGSFLELAQETTDPQLQTELINTFSGMGVAPRETLEQLVQYTVPNSGVMQRFGVRRGLMNAEADGTAASLYAEAAARDLTGQNEGQVATSHFLEGVVGRAQDFDPDFKDALARSWAVRNMTGTNETGLAVDRAGAALPGEVHNRAAQIDLGTALSEAQGASNEVGWGHLRLGHDQLAAQMAAQQAGLDLDMMRVRAAQVGAGPDVSQILSTLTSALATLAERKTNMKEAELQIYVNNINVMLNQLKQAGILPQEQPLMSSDGILRPNRFGSYLGAGRGGAPADATRIQR